MLSFMQNMVAEYKLALEIKPGEFALWYNRGRAHYKLQQYDLALTCMNQVLELKPDHANASICLSSISRAKQATETSGSFKFKF